MMMVIEAGVDKMNKLRAVLLYMANYIHNNKIFCRDIMWIAELAEVIAPEK